MSSTTAKDPLLRPPTSTSGDARNSSAPPLDPLSASPLDPLSGARDSAASEDRVSARATVEEEASLGGPAPGRCTDEFSPPLSEPEDGAPLKNGAIAANDVPTRTEISAPVLSSCMSGGLITSTASRPLLDDASFMEDEEYARFLADGELDLMEGAVGGTIGQNRRHAETKKRKEAQFKRAFEQGDSPARSLGGSTENDAGGYSSDNYSDCVDKTYCARILSVGYMQGVLDRTDAIIAQKKEQIKAWDQIHRYLRIFLIVLAVLGVGVAIFKTVLQPDVVYSLQQYLQPVDVVFLLDSSAIMAPNRAQQKQAVTTFAASFETTIREMKAEQKAKRLAEEGQNRGGMHLLGSGDNTIVWPVDHKGLRFSVARFASSLPGGATTEVGLSEFGVDEHKEGGDADCSADTGGGDEETHGGTLDPKSGLCSVAGPKMAEFFEERMQYQSSDAALMPAVQTCGSVLQQEDAFHQTLDDVVADTRQQSLDVNVPIGCLVRFEQGAGVCANPEGHGDQFFKLPALVLSSSSTTIGSGELQQWYVDIAGVEGNGAGASAENCEARETHFRGLCGETTKVFMRYVPPPAWEETFEHYQERKKSQHTKTLDKLKDVGVSAGDAAVLLRAFENRALSPADQSTTVPAHEKTTPRSVFQLPSRCFAYLPDTDSQCKQDNSGISFTKIADTEFYALNRKIRPWTAPNDLPREDPGVSCQQRFFGGADGSRYSQSQSIEEECGGGAVLFDIGKVDWVNRERSKRFCVVIGDPLAKCMLEGKAVGFGGPYGTRTTDVGIGVFRQVWCFDTRNCAKILRFSGVGVSGSVQD